MVDDKNSGHEPGELSDADLTGVAGGYSWNDFKKDVGGAADTVVDTGQHVVNTVQQGVTQTNQQIVNTGQQVVANVVDAGHQAYNGAVGAANGFVLTGQAAAQFAFQQAEQAQKIAQQQAEEVQRIAKAAQQQAEQEAQKAAKNPAGTAAQFTGAGLVSTLIEQTTGKKPTVPGIPAGVFSGGSLFEQATTLVKGGTPKPNLPNPTDLLPKGVVQQIAQVLQPQQEPGKDNQPPNKPKIMPSQPDEQIKVQEKADKLRDAQEKLEQAEKNKTKDPLEQVLASLKPLKGKF